jgi:hypothetical protein
VTSVPIVKRKSVFKEGKGMKKKAPASRIREEEQKSWGFIRLRASISSTLIEDNSIIYNYTYKIK